MDPQDDVEGFTAKWRERWPEWTVAGVFVPAPWRPLVEAWFALLQEFTDAAWGGDDATPGLAKLAWWSEELRGWAKGARRHPLGAVLQRQAVDWTALATALRGLQAARGRVPPEAADLAAFAEAVARIEAILFDGALDGEAGQGAASRVLADVLAEHALAHGVAPSAAPRPRRDAGTRPRRIQSALLSARLARLAAGRPVGALRPWRSLWLAWGAARAG